MKPLTLLKYTSIFFILYGGITSLLLVISTANYAIAVSGIDEVLVYLLLGLAGSGATLAAGITGLKAKQIKTCKVFSIIVLLWGINLILGPMNIFISGLYLAMAVGYFFGISRLQKETRGNESLNNNPIEEE